MLLGIDIGNTHITLGLFDKEKLIYDFRLTTKITRTSDEYGIILEDLLRSRNVSKEDLDDVSTRYYAFI